MRIGKKLLFALLTTVLLFGAVELLLWGLGAALGRDWRVDPLPAHEDYEVLCEFGDLLRLCPDRGPSYERVRPLVFSQDKELPRVVTIGESFVYGLGLPAEEAWPARLQAHLEAQGTPAEVLNLGRCGTYASRLVPLVQAAIRLDADVVVIAAGNNEHTMTSFYTGPAGRHPLTVYRISSVLGRLRTYGLLVSTIGLPTRVEESFTEQPKQFGAELDRQVYAARRRPPDLSAFEEPGRTAGAFVASQQATAILEEEQRLKERIFAGHMARMLDLLAEADIPVVLGTVPRDLTVPPVLSGSHRASRTAILEMIDKLENPDPRQSPPPDPDVLLDRALSIDDKVSYFHYKRGQHLRNIGPPDAAADAFRQAVEWDLVPDATPSINNITLSLAAERGLPALDIDGLADRWLNDPDAFFLDKVHVSAQGADVIGQELAGVVAGELRAE